MKRFSTRILEINGRAVDMPIGVMLQPSMGAAATQAAADELQNNDTAIVEVVSARDTVKRFRVHVQQYLKVTCGEVKRTGGAA